MWVVKKVILIAGFAWCARLLLAPPKQKKWINGVNDYWDVAPTNQQVLYWIGATLFITAAAYVLAGFLDRKRPRVIDAEPVAGELVRR